MPTRAKKLIDAIQPEIEEKTRQTLEQIRQQYEAERAAIHQSFRKAFEDGLEAVAAAMPEKGKIVSLHVSYLLSSLLVGKYEFRIDFYNSNLYRDNLETACYWRAEFLAPFFKEDLPYFEKLIREKDVRVKKYEIKDLVLDFGAVYYTAFASYLPALFSSLPLTEYESFFTDNVEIMYGGFQDNNIPIDILYRND